MNQDRIKDRILRRASRLWGYNELESENSFDPIVGLLLSAIASELERLGFALESSNSRMIERILELLFPENISGVHPAYSLVQVEPQDDNPSLSLYDSFKTTKNIVNIFNPSENTLKDIYFSPTIETQLHKAKVEYIAFGNDLNKIESYFFTERIGRANRPLKSGELWLGIRCFKEKNIENLQFYIDINNSYQKEFFFYHLKQAKIYFGDKEMQFEEGYNVELKNIDLEGIISKNYHYLSQIYSEINDFYKPYFFTLKEKISLAEQTEKPIIFRENFPEHQLSDAEDIIWLKLEFSEMLTSEVFENVSFNLNCFPIVNIKNTRLFRRMNGKLDIVSIQSDDHFLDLDYVKNDEGDRLDLKNDNQRINVVLRRGGVARFDQRNASELLQYLLELIKDESAAFSSIGGDMTRETLRSIQQNVAALEQLSKEKNFVQASNPYLVISSANGDALSCDISYWLTTGEEGNDIKPGTNLEIDNSKSLSFSKAVMLKSSFGGRKSLSVQDKILEYRSSMLSRGRIVTAADIKNFGNKHFKQTISGIEIKKGTKKEVSNKGGFTRTIDVYITRNQSSQPPLSETEWQYLCDSFLLYLEKNSANIYPYRLINK